MVATRLHPCSTTADISAGGLGHARRADRARVTECAGEADDDEEDEVGELRATGGDAAARDEAGAAVVAPAHHGRHQRWRVRSCATSRPRTRTRRRTRRRGRRRRRGRGRRAARRRRRRGGAGRGRRRRDQVTQSYGDCGSL